MTTTFQSPLTRDNFGSTIFNNRHFALRETGLLGHLSVNVVLTATAFRIFVHLGFRQLFVVAFSIW